MGFRILIMRDYTCPYTMHVLCEKNRRFTRAVRNVLGKMNFDVVETERSGTRAVCCGDDFYPKLPVDKVHQQMKKRADSMPCDDVCVYCVSCIKAFYIGGKTPRHGKYSVNSVVVLVISHN